MRAFTTALRRGVVMTAAAALAACAEGPEPADLVLINGKVVTVDDLHPDAEAVAMRGDRIVAVGTNAEIDALVGSGTEVVDLEGRLAVPGFIEGHGHYTSLGRAKMILDFNAVSTWDEIVGMVADAAQAAEPGAWIQGRGWHQEKWSSVPQPNVDGVPLHAGLSAASPDNPVLLGHASGHAAFANARAMELAGIDRATADPPGGTIVKDASGNPTGLLRETAQRLVSGVMGEELAGRSEGEIWNEFVQQVELAGEEALSKGVTSFQDAGSNFETIDGLKRLADEGRLPIRLYIMVRFESNERMRTRLPEYRMVGQGNHFLTVRAIKRQNDGALGAHGAWLLEPYDDLPGNTGLVLETLEDIEETARIAVEHGFQVNTHAIGDRSNREILDLYQRIFEEHPDFTDARWRIEHAQHLHPDDIGRFAELGVIAAMQGIHATSDAPWVYRRLGAARAESGAYMWRDLIDSGAIVTNGTDVPVEDIDPLASFTASVVRKDKDGNDFFPAQKMTRLEALQTYTINNAFAAFEEDLKGSVTVGKLGDIVVLSSDIMTVPDEELPEARVDLTILGGEVRYRREH